MAEQKASKQRPANPGYEWVYRPLSDKKWDPAKLNEYFLNSNKAKTINLDDPEGVKGLEALMGAEVGTFDRNTAEAYRAAYVEELAKGATDHVLARAGDVAKYVGAENVLPAILKYGAVEKRKAKGKEISESNQKYNAAVDAVLNYRAVVEGISQNRNKALEDELSGISDLVKGVLQRVVGDEGLLAHRRERAERRAIDAIVKYCGKSGPAKMLTELIALGKVKKTEFEDEYKKINAKIREALEKKTEELPRALNTQERAEVTGSFKDSIGKLNEKYAPYLKNQQIANDEECGLINLAIYKLLQEQAAKKAEEAARTKKK